MGTWAIDAFGNDEACDWAQELIEHEDLSFVEQTLADVLEQDDDNLDSDLASQGVAAAEVIAGLQGRPGISSSYSEDVDRWVVGIGVPPPAKLAKMAHAVLDRIVGDGSELADLWLEEDDATAWRSYIAELKRRIHVG